MRLILMYDLPVNSKKMQKEYNKFHNIIVNYGFIIIQYSVYVKICINYDETIKYIKKIELVAPNNGNVRVFSVTEKQYEAMKIITGSQSFQEIMSDNKKVIEL